MSREDMNRRLEGLNQLRNEVVTDRSEFQRKESCDTQHRELVQWRRLSTKINVLETRSITWTAAVGVFFIILGFVLDGSEVRAAPEVCMEGSMRLLLFL